MSFISIPEKLREKLGNEASEKLASMLNERDEENRRTIMQLFEGKFASTLIEEAAAIRNEMGDIKTHFETRITEEISGLRNDMVRGDEALRSELKQEISDLREDMVRGDESIRSEIHSTRADLLKWMFIFWVGQVGVITALLLTIVG
jgi:hypothetical protein